MDPPTTGLGLFTRPPTRAGAGVTSIAVDLGLGATLPDPARPWAGRIAVPLRRPSVDGLARDPSEIDRLATLGRATFAVLGPSATFAAVVTAGGVRTWLLYAAGPAATAVAVDVEAAAGRAFDGTDYRPDVTVVADADWDGYRLLFPTEAEIVGIAAARAEATAVAAARTATHAAVRAMHAAGTDLTRPTAVRYAVAFPASAPAADAFYRRAAATGLRAEGASLVREDLPDIALILRTERWLIRESARAGGRYAGWTAAA